MQSLRHRRVWFGLLCAAVLAVPATAAADEGPHRFSNVRFEVHADLGWYAALGGGFRLEFPLVREGLLQGVNDELALSLGAELLYSYAPGFLGLAVYPVAALQWNFFLGSNVSLFPELGAAVLVGPGRERYWGTFLAPYLGFGGRLHFSSRNALLLRVSWPAGLQVGLTF